MVVPESSAGRDRQANKDIQGVVLDSAREKAKLKWVGFHDLRHYFASMAVMSGIDFKTIAEWLGHQDGGMLVGKVYGHLLPEHRQRMADRLMFYPAVVKFSNIASHEGPFSNRAG